MKRIISCLLVLAFLAVGVTGCNLYDPYGGLMTPKLFGEADKTGEFWLKGGASENGMALTCYMALKDDKAVVEISDGRAAMRIIIDSKIPAYYIVNDASKTIFKYEEEQEENFFDNFLTVSRNKQDWTCGNETLNGYLYYYEETTDYTGEKVRYYYNSMGDDGELKYMTSNDVVIEVYEYGTSDVDDSAFELPLEYRTVESKN